MGKLVGERQEMWNIGALEPASGDIGIISHVTAHRTHHESIPLTQRQQHSPFSAEFRLKLYVTLSFLRCVHFGSSGVPDARLWTFLNMPDVHALGNASSAMSVKRVKVVQVSRYRCEGGRGEEVEAFLRGVAGS